MIRAIVFDLGNVIFDCSIDPAVRYWSGITRKPPAVLNDLLDLDHEVHHRFERGEIPEEEFRMFISESIQHALSQEDFRLGWNSIYAGIRPGIGELLDRLKLSYRIVGLTNTNKTHAAVWTVKCAEVLRKFEVVSSSHELGFRKPESGAYRACLDYLQIPPPEVVFLDDKLENVMAAKRLGMEGLLVTTFERMESELLSAAPIR